MAGESEIGTNSLNHSNSLSMSNFFRSAFCMVFIVSTTCFVVINQLLGQETTTDEGELENIFERQQTNTVELQSLIFNLNSEQLQFKPDDESWSIAEIVEHIVITDRILLDRIKKAVKSGPNPEHREEITITEEDLLNIMLDRDRSGQASEILHPEGNYKSFRMAIEKFVAGQHNFREYLKEISTEKNLRNYVIDDMPFGSMDALQVALLSTAHAQRHFLQIEEVKAHGDFPQGR